METASVGAEEARHYGRAGAQNEPRRARSPLSQFVLPATLAGLTVYFGFEAGGYFADTTGWPTAGMAIALAIAALVFGRRPSSHGWPLAAAAGALALLAIWTLASSAWSDATARAVVEFDRVLLYLLTLVLFGAASAPSATLKRLPAAFALAALVLCGAGLFARTLPDVWPFALPIANARMDFPVSYENALGALASLGFVFSLHLASWRQETALLHILAAASLPLFAAALVLTFSRGAIAAGLVGTLVYAVFGRSRGLLATVLAAGPFVGLAVVSAYQADLISSWHPRTAAAVAQGEDLAILLCAASMGAGLLRGLLSLERWSGLLRGHRVARPTRGWVVAAVVVAVVAVAGAAVTLEPWHDLYDGAFQPNQSEGPALTRDRLTEPGSANLRAHSRAKYWDVALDAFSQQPVKGTGVGTFPKLWARDRPTAENVTEGHSVYIETLAELGLVGVVLLVSVLTLVLWPFVAGLRGPQSRLHGGIIAAAVVWLLHAGLDWDWEMPVLTLWLFAMGGCALAARVDRAGGAEKSAGLITRVLLASAFVLAALTPATVAVSQVHLDKSVGAFKRNDCETAERSAHSSISVLSARPEPYAILAYCAVRGGVPGAAVSAMRHAVDRDPGSWEYVYGLALVRAAAGRDPRPAARAARRLNPLEQLTVYAVEQFDTAKPRVWRRRAAGAPLPLPSGQRGVGAP